MSEMTAEAANRTLVCSVLFIDIVGYSKKGVTEQVRIKQAFNSVLGNALEQVPPRERVVVDTGDGAAVTFLGDPEGALFVALAVLDAVGELPVRMGINLGPVSLMKDINGSDNVIGDGINVAERVMSFAAQDQLLVSRSFFEVVSLLAPDYAAMFRHEPTRTDKHERAHDLYSVTDAVRVGRRVQEAQARLKSQRRSAAPEPRDAGPAQIFDAGTHFIVSGHSQSRVQEAVQALRLQGCKLISPVSQVGSKWVASVENPRLANPATVQEMGFKRFISGPTREAVLAKIQELVERGAVLIRDAELADGVWTAVCEKT
jgi:class 3 adenylate cyclase